MISTQSIQAAFAADHDRLDSCLLRFQAMKRSNFADAREYFKEFKFGLQRHITWEEQILFPRFEAKTGSYGAGPTEVMRREHRRIGALLEAIHQKVRRTDPESDKEERDLLEVLAAHNQKEENVLYPILDRLLSDAEKAEVFEAMEKLPPEAYKTCCGGHG
jgi:iron-sulfur cluster repair protein YtfE (RIC family)